MPVGALIAAAGMSSRMNGFKPMMRIGSITVIERVIYTLRQAGTDPVVVVTGNRAEELERHIAGQHVVCLRNEEYETTEMLDSAKIGFHYLVKTCDRVLFTPADVPLFTVNTVLKLMKSEESITIPVWGKKEGHPLMMTRPVMEYICSYKGEMGIRGGLEACGRDITYMDVQDDCILYDMDTPEDYETMVKKHESFSGY